MKKSFNIDWKKSYEIQKLIKKRDRKYERTKMTKYLIRWLKYESKFDEWKSLSALTNFMTLMKNYEKVNFQLITSISNSTSIIDFILSIFNNSKRKSNRLNKTITNNQQKRKRDRFKKMRIFWVNAYVDFFDE